MKEGIKKSIEQYLKDNVSCRNDRFFVAKEVSGEYIVLNSSNDIFEMRKIYKACADFYSDVVEFIYDKKNDRLLDLYEDPNYAELKANDEAYLEEEKPMSDIDRHKFILDSMHDLYVRKNTDYGNSFSQSFDEYGITAGLVRMEDKWNRLKSLTKNGFNLVEDEKIEDTLIDLANYSIMLYMELTRDDKT